MTFTKSRLTLGWTGSLLAIALPGLLTAEPPTLPDVEELVAARRAVGSEVQRAEMAQVQYAVDQKGWVKSLVIDRVEFSGSYGEGLTLQSQENNDAITNVVADKTEGKWAVTYKVPLSAVFQTFSGENMAKLDLDLAEAKHRQALLDAEVAIREAYSDYLLARSTFKGSSSEGPRTAGQGKDASKIAKAGFEMREAALKMLVLANRQGTPEFDQWVRFLNETSEGGVRLASN